ncbi:polygalacturonase inhibitor-like [Chenopodium quinoa]|uniref:polygalacturonase inhibitor-like n=1 Tax=Chenopodium quinoa TaxID=63459 RepID=UPI000B782EA4|nr:polygalacturonase inhibitor-like [Chenopodium quinoa]
MNAYKFHNQNTLYTNSKKKQTFDIHTKQHKMKSQLKISLFLFSLLITTSSLLTLSLAAELCHPNDKNALLEIKAHLGPNTTFFSSWQPNTDCCKTWYNVGCDNQTNRVKYLTIGQNNELIGQIPPIVGQLTGLEVLYFNDMPGLTGLIPSSISNLVNLQDLEFFRTNLTGSIPQSLYRLKKLNILDLSENKFNGLIPASLSRIPNLQKLTLQKNQLSGSIPESFSSFKNLALQVSDNNLSGPIPKSLSQAGFSWLDLSNNQFIGDASFLFRNPKLILIYLRNNAFSFDFSNVVFNSRLQGLDVSHNMIYGSLPRQLSQLPLQVFNVSYNQLCGPVPTGKWLTRFGADSFENNKCLCGGPLPACK